MIQLHVADILSITTRYNLSSRNIIGVQQTLAILTETPLREIQENWKYRDIVDEWHKQATARIAEANLEWVESATKSYITAAQMCVPLNTRYKIIEKVIEIHGTIHEIPLKKKPPKATYQSRKLRLHSL